MAVSLQNCNSLAWYGWAAAQSCLLVHTEYLTPHLPGIAQIYLAAFWHWLLWAGRQRAYGMLCLASFVLCCGTSFAYHWWRLKTLLCSSFLILTESPGSHEILFQRLPCSLLLLLLVFLLSILYTVVLVFFSLASVSSALSLSFWPAAIDG